jgi:hypothetical protein
VTARRGGGGGAAAAVGERPARRPPETPVPAKRTSCRSPEHARANGVEENVGADAIEQSAGQLNRLNDVEPPVGDRYADMTPINR